MNEIAPALTADVAELVLGSGDLSRLTPTQRVQYMLAACRSLGLNPLTRPFRFIKFATGEVQLYATKDCTDQLRALRKIDLNIVSKGWDGETYVVTAHARTADGRQDEDIGAVFAGKLTGDWRANALMKCHTKAKRRVTLSVCGAGVMDESEAETIQGATTFDAEADPPEVRPPPLAQPPKEPPNYPFATNKGGQVYHSSKEWIERWRRTEEACRLTDAPEKLRNAWEMNAPMIAEVARFDKAAADEVLEILAEARKPHGEGEMELP